MKILENVRQPTSKTTKPTHKVFNSSTMVHMCSLISKLSNTLRRPRLLLNTPQLTQHHDQDPVSQPRYSCFFLKSTNL